MRPENQNQCQYLPRKLHRKRLHTTNYFIYYLNKFSFNYSPESIRIQTRMCVYLKFRFILQLNRSVFGESLCSNTVFRLPVLYGLISHTSIIITVINTGYNNCVTHKILSI